MRYKQQFDGEWIQPKRKYYYMQCCDCGLSHRVEFRVVKDKIGRVIIQMRAWRLRKNINFSVGMK